MNFKYHSYVELYKIFKEQETHVYNYYNKKYNNHVSFLDSIIWDIYDWLRDNIQYREARYNDGNKCYDLVVSQIKTVNTSTGIHLVILADKGTESAHHIFDLHNVTILGYY